MRGTRDDGENLVIARDYIKDGMRDRARDLITQELAPRTDLDIRRSPERHIEAERRTQLDRHGSWSSRKFDEIKAEFCICTHRPPMRIAH